MREILFKAKRIDNGEWVEGFYYNHWKHAYMLWGTCNGIPDMIEVIPKTVCQFTGQYDKNGMKIFEWDNIKHKDGRVATVEFCVSSLSYQMNFFRCVMDQEDNADYTTIEVIGNIHDGEVIV